MQEESRVRLLAEGIWRITTPMPYRPRSVHAYLVDVGDGRWFLLDGGIDSDLSWQLLDGAVARIAGGWSGVSLHVISHMHLDHIGLAPRIGRACAALLAIGELDASRAAHAAANPREETAFREALLRRCGAPAEAVQALQRVTTPPENRDFRPADLQLASVTSPLPDIPGWLVVWTPGHTAGHISLFRESDRLLLAGDAVLPRVTPTIGVNRQREDPVADYLDTLDRLQAMEPELGFCGHGEPLSEPRERIHQLRAATWKESSRVIAILGDEPRSVWQVVEQRYADRELPWSVRMLALRETLAHLQHAVEAGRARREMEGRIELFALHAAPR